MINIKEILDKLPQEPREVGTIPEMGFYYRETANSHEYYYDKRRMTGVTTILNSIAKPNLIQWATDLAADYLFEIFTKTGLINKENVDAAKLQHTMKKESAADIGTRVHDACEQFLKKGILPDFELDSIEDKCFKNFKEWWGTDKRLIESEMRLYNLDYWFAGTCDFIYEQGGNIYVGDIKTSSAKRDWKSKEEKYDLWDRTYHAQTAAYQYAFEKLTGKKVHGRIIVRIGKDGSFSTHESYAFEQDFAVFIAALTIHRYNKP